MKLFSIHAGMFRLDGGAMHGVVPKSLWQKINPADDQNLCPWAMRCLLIEHGNYRILIDTGMGDKQDEKFFGHYHPHGEQNLLDSLAKRGYSPEDITDVFLTHLHFDHVGGALVRRGEEIVPTFPKALYWSNLDHWKVAIQPNAREKASFLPENILPLEKDDRLRFVESADGEEWMDGIRVRQVQGHTEAMMLPLIEYRNRRILYCADLLPSQAHISLPWVMAYDMRPLDTLREKAEILEQAVEEDWILFFEHDPRVECALLHRDDRGRIRVKETFPLEELDQRI